MGKLPYMQFYHQDYQRDTRCLSLAARGAWMDILCTLWNAPDRGRRILSLEGWASQIGKPESEVSLVIYELIEKKVGKVLRQKDERISIISGRMVRDEVIRKLAAKRKQKQRDSEESRGQSRNGHGDVTGIYQKSEVRSHTSEEELREEEEKSRVSVKRLPLVVSDADWLKSLASNPAYQHINLPVELGKMDAWLGLPKHRHRKRTRQFVLNWLNKVEPTMNGTGKPQPPPFPPANDPIARNSWRQAYGDPKHYGY